MTYHNTYLAHHGILGQRWGVRRYQNVDGTLTPAGKRRKAKLEKKYERVTGEKLENRPRSPELSQYSNKELQEIVNRKRLEKQFYELDALPEEKSRGRRFAEEWGKEIVKGMVVDATKEVGKEYIRSGEKALIKTAVKRNQRKKYWNPINESI